MPNIFIAGGGSGGHVAPAIATAEALHDVGYSAILGHSCRQIDALMVNGTDFPHHVLPARPLTLKPRGLLRFFQGFNNTVKHVCALIEKEHIECVVATGGFVAAPALRAAYKCGCPTVLLNIDDPPGKANRLAVRWANTVLSTTDCALGNPTLVSPPLRKCVIAPIKSNSCYEAFQLDPHRLTLLVTGASQGAMTINELLPALAKQHPSHFHGWQVLHITGSGNVERVKELWKESDIPAHTVEFVEQMGVAWGVADLAITRGGANTIAELAINAVPAVVLPYPYHRDEHQRKNALFLKSIGGVYIEKDRIKTDINITHAGSTILTLLKDHQARFAMRQALASNTPINGAVEIGNACIDSIKQ